MAVYLGEHVERLRADAVPRKIDNTVSDNLLDQWLQDVNLIIAATDDRRAQRRIGQRALSLGIPSLFPGLYVNGGGEIIVQMDNQLPCFSCWDEFRDDSTQLRGAAASNFLALPVIYTTVRLTIGILDPGATDERRLMYSGRGSPPYTVFGINRLGTLESSFNTRRPTCSICGGSAARIQSVSALPARIETPASPESAPSDTSTPSADDMPLEGGTIAGDAVEVLGVWLIGCLCYSVLMLLPDIWLASWAWAIVVSPSKPFSISFYLIFTLVIGALISTGNVARERT